MAVFEFDMPYAASSLLSIVWLQWTTKYLLPDK